MNMSVKLLPLIWYYGIRPGLYSIGQSTYGMQLMFAIKPNLLHFGQLFQLASTITLIILLLLQLKTNLLETVTTYQLHLAAQTPFVFLQRNNCWQVSDLIWYVLHNYAVAPVASQLDKGNLGGSPGGQFQREVLRRLYVF